MAVETPIVRYFVACRQVDVEPGSNEVSLRRLVHAVVRLPAEPFPCICEELALYALLSNGRGEHDVAIEFTFQDPVEEQVVYRSVAKRIDLGQDPTAVQGLPIPLKNVIFNQGGQFRFHLLCNDQGIAEVLLDVR